MCHTIFYYYESISNLEEAEAKVGMQTSNLEVALK